MGDDSVAKTPTGYWYTMGHPLKPDIDQALLQLLAAGLHQRAYDRQAWMLGRAAREHARREENNQNIVLGLRHTMPMFMLIGLLLSVSQFVFVGEILKTRPLVTRTFHRLFMSNFLEQELK